jgi:hypothetical protein
VAAPREEAAPPPLEKQAVSVEFTFTRPPTALKIEHLGKEVWAGTALEREAEAEFQVPYPKQGIELVFTVTWPEGELAAMRVRLSDRNGERHERTIWGKGETTEVLSFP